MGVLMIVQAVPGIIIGPLAGVFIDRVEKRRVLIITHAVQAALTCLIPFASSILQIYLIAGVLAIARQFFNPARMALLPELVGRDDLTRANSLSMLVNHILLMVGPAAAGVVVAFSGTDLAFFIDAGTFLVAALILFGIASYRVPSVDGEVVGGFVAQFKEGVAFMLGNPLIRYLVPFLALIVLVASMQSPLVVVFVKSVLLRGDVELGVLMGALGAGGIIGGTVAGILAKRITRARNIAWLIFLDGLVLILFAFNRNYPVAVGIFVLFGTIAATAQIIIMSLLQAHIPDEKRGRVFANLTPILGPLSIISIGVGTFLADVIGVVVVLALSGAAECVSAVVAPLTPGYRRKLKEIDERENVPQL